MRKTFLSLVALLAALLVLPVVSALSETDLATNWVIEVNGDEVAVGKICTANNEAVCSENDGTTPVVQTISVDEGQTIDVEVTLVTGDLGTETSIEDIEVEARIKGYEYSRN